MSGQVNNPSQELGFSPDSFSSLDRTATPSPTFDLPQTNTGQPEAGNSFNPVNQPVIAVKDEIYTHLFSFDLAASNLVHLTNNKWDDAYPEISPDGTKIAFASNRNGYWDIYVMDLVNGEVSQTTNTPEYDGSPSWSPDGQWLVFESYLDSNLEIQIISTSAGDLKPIRLTDDLAADHSPVWAPQGRTILFVSTRTGDEEIWMADLDSSDNRFTNLSDQPASQDRDPAWSPDGSVLAWSSVSNGIANLLVYDLTAETKDIIGVGSLPAFSPDGRTILAVIENPNENFITGYSIETKSIVIIPKVLPGNIYGITWNSSMNVFSPFQEMEFPESKSSDDAVISIQETSTDSQPGISGISQLEGINVPYPYLHNAVIPSFQELHIQTEKEIGWNFLDCLENAFLPLTEPPLPGVNQSWLYTGRAIEVNPMPLYGGWMYLVREDFYGQTFWRMYLKTRLQDGSQGLPLKSQVWNFNARYSGDTQSYENGGETNGVPEGYWFDFTELALSFGWRRVPALNNWRTYFDGTMFNQFIQAGQLNWRSAMEELYPPEALATATRFPTKTTTPTVTSTFTRTPRYTATVLPERTSTPTVSRTPALQE